MQRRGINGKMRQFLAIPELRSLNFDKIERLQDAKFHAVAKNLLPQTKFYSNLFKEYGIDPAKSEHGKSVNIDAVIDRVLKTSVEE